MADLSLQYHSLRLYRGAYWSHRDIPYRIGNEATIIQDREERYYDTWEDFHLIPNERPTVTLPKANQKLVSIPGKSLPIDLTNNLTGYSSFGNRSGSWSFYTDNDFVNAYAGGWEAFDKNIRDKIHGRTFKVQLRDDSRYFYYGELSVGQWSTGESFSTVTISYNFYPFKKSMLSTMDFWKFDEFNFQEDIIMFGKGLAVDGIRMFKLYGGRERISPHISSEAPGLVIYKWEKSAWKNYGDVPIQPLRDAGSIVPGLAIDEGYNLLKFEGRGTVTIDYRRGLL